MPTIDVAIQQTSPLSPDDIADLVQASAQEDWQFVRRLSDGLRSGSNRFDRPGEALFTATVGQTIVGICGLNIDPYAADDSIGRVRHLYVLPTHRRHGIAQRLVQVVIAAAAPRFRLLRVRTENPQAGRLYKRLGFHPVTDDANCTHALELSPAATRRK
jgi:ribosomal protein S18 acetylase RimI-like enzyme